MGAQPKVEDFTVEPGERGEVYLDCPVEGCRWDALAAWRTLGDVLASARDHLAAAHGGAR